MKPKPDWTDRASDLAHDILLPFAAAVGLLYRLRVKLALWRADPLVEMLLPDGVMQLPFWTIPREIRQARRMARSIRDGSLPLLTTDQLKAIDEGVKALKRR